MTKKQKKELLSVVEKRREQSFALFSTCPLCKEYIEGGKGLCAACPARIAFKTTTSYCISFCEARNNLWNILNEMVGSLK